MSLQDSEFSKSEYSAPWRETFEKPGIVAEQVKIVTACKNEGIIAVTRKWEYWSGKNQYSSTISSFVVGGTKIEGYIAEPYGEETIKSGKDKRIPVGTYNLTWHTSNNFPKNKYIANGLPKLKNGFPKLYNDKVSKSRGILIHIGNYGRDTEGCLLPGSGISKKEGKVNSVTGSSAMFYKLINYIEKRGIENIKVVIKDEIL